MRRVGFSLLVQMVVLAALSLLAPLLATPPSSAVPPDRDTYRNPLAPRIPGGGTVDSCADQVAGNNRLRAAPAMKCRPKSSRAIKH